MLLMAGKGAAWPASPPQRPDPLRRQQHFLSPRAARHPGRPYAAQGRGDEIAQPGRKDEGTSPRPEAFRDSLRNNVSGEMYAGFSTHLWSTSVAPVLGPLRSPAFPGSGTVRECAGQSLPVGTGVAARAGRCSAERRARWLCRVRGGRPGARRAGQPRPRHRSLARERAAGPGQPRGEGALLCAALGSVREAAGAAPVRAAGAAAGRWRGR